MSIGYYDPDDRLLYCTACAPKRTDDLEAIETQLCHWQDYDEERSCFDCGTRLVYTEDELEEVRFESHCEPTEED